MGNGAGTASTQPSGPTGQPTGNGAGPTAQPSGPSGQPMGSVSGGSSGAPTGQPAGTSRQVATTMPMVVSRNCNASSLGLPPGRVSSKCNGLRPGQTCTASCSSPFVGDDVTATCLSTGFFDISGGVQPCLCDPSLLPKVSASGASLDASGCGDVTTSSTCRLSCSGGMVGYAPYTCTASGSWTGTPPTCLPASCSGNPNVPPVAGVQTNMSCTKLTVGSTCMESCVTGYTGSPSTYSCVQSDTGSSAQLVGRAPQCQPVASCSWTSTSSSYNSSCSSVAAGSQCIVKCAAGYTGKSVYKTCSSQGVLSTTLPTCVPITCNAITSAANVDMSPCQGTTVGQTCTPKCYSGYKISSTVSTLTCLASGNFDASVTCAPLVCSMPAVSLHTGVTTTCSAGMLQSQTCISYCSQGYSGSPVQAMCDPADINGDGFAAFSYGTAPAIAVAPTCTANQCSPLGSIYGFTDNCTGVTTGQTCMQKAKGHSFRASITTALQCQASGQITGVLATAVAVACSLPSEFTSSVKSNCVGADGTTPSITLGQSCWAFCSTTNAAPVVLQYSCNNSDTMVLTPVTTAISGCVRRLDNAQFRGARQLQGTCFASSAMSASMYSTTCSSVSAGGYCIVSCSAGYNMVQASPALYQCNNSQLGAVQASYTMPTCNPVPCTYNLPVGLGVSHTCAGVGTGSTCTALCGMPGYQLASGPASFTYTCLASGAFSSSGNPTCAPITCSALTVSAAYQSNCANVAFGQTCSVGCADGYSLQGSVQSWSCQANSSLTGNWPMCTPTACKNSVPVANSIMASANCAGLVTGQSCSVGCANGYQGSATTYTCSSSGLITGTLPSCMPMQCNPPSSAPDGTVNDCSGISVGGSCTVSCAPGYMIQSGGVPQQMTCTAGSSSSVSLTSSDPSPVCNAVPCASYAAPDPTFFTSNCSNVGTGGTCTVGCATGYTGSPTTLTCLSNQYFSTNLPTCTPAACSLPTTVPAGVDLGDCNGATNGGYPCWAICTAGYSGNATQMSCGVSNGQLALTGTMPTCAPLTCSYGLPQDPSFVSTCTTSVQVNHTCTVSCAPGYTGAAAVYMCEATQTFVGNPPICQAPAVSSPGTTTSSGMRLDFSQSSGAGFGESGKAFFSLLALVFVGRLIQ